MVWVLISAFLLLDITISSRSGFSPCVQNKAVAFDPEEDADPADPGDLAAEGPDPVLEVAEATELRVTGKGPPVGWRRLSVLVPAHHRSLSLARPTAR